MIVGPIVVFCLLATATLVTINVVAILSAMGHGSLTREEAIPMYVIGGVVALAGATVTALGCERWALHATHERTPEQRTVTRFTRTASFAICVVLVVVTPPLVREGRFQSKSATATGRFPVTHRQLAISELAWERSPRSLEVLRRVALNSKDHPSVRQSAIWAMWNYPDAKPLVIALADDASADVRAAAGFVLLQSFAADEAAWATIERLAREDASPVVRKQMIGLLKGSTHPRAPGLLRELGEITDGTPRPGPGTYDGALAILMDVNDDANRRLGAIETLAQLKDERALSAFETIVTGTVDPGFVPSGREEGFRRAAREAGARLVMEPHPDWMIAYDNENHAVFAIEHLINMHLGQRRIMGFFDLCADRRVPCISLPAQGEMSLVPLRGYAGLFHAGPPASPDDVAAKKARPTSVTSFAFVAVPEAPFKTGIRGFCADADDTRRICFTRDGRPPTLVDGRCPDSVALPPDYAPVYPDSVNAPRECRASR
jgi:hypothetical protein